MIFSAITPRAQVDEGKAPWDDYWYTNLTKPTASGVDVADDQALGVSAFYCGVNLLANALKILPLFVYRQMDDGGKQLLRDHPAYRVLHDVPNQWQTAGKFRWWMQASALLWGNAFAEIKRGSGMEVLALVPIHASTFLRAAANGANGELRYLFRLGAGETWIEGINLLHHFGPSRNGVVGDSIVSLARETLGFNVALERSGSGFFGRGARPIGIIKHPGTFRKEEDAKRFREQWQMAFSGAGAHGTAVLEDGMEWQPIGMPNEDAQFLETRTFQVTEIARWLNLPPHKLYELSRATFSNIEHQSIEYVQDSVLPWASDFEAECGRKLFLGPDGDLQDDLFAEFQFSGLLRGDSVARAQTHRERWNIGSRTINEIRRLENEDPIDHPAGNWIFLPSNMVAIDENGELVKFAGADTPPSAEVENDEDGENEDSDAPMPMPMPEDERRDNEDDAASATLLGYVIEDIAGRLACQEIGALTDRLKHRTHDPERFKCWVERYYNAYGGKVATALGPIARHLDWSAAHLNGLLQDIVASGRTVLLNSNGNSEQLLTRWQRQRAVELHVLLRKAVNNGT